MKCINCGKNAMVSHRETRKLESLGLSNVVLKDAEVFRCTECGEEELVLPNIEELHRLIAKTVVEKSAKLIPEEIRFLRKYLGWSGLDFAHHFGVAPETVSRWEHGKTEMSGTTERLLRLAVVHWAPVDNYPVEAMDKIKERELKPLRVDVRRKKNRWELAPA